jgi:hypothetical protein
VPPDDRDDDPEKTPVEPLLARRRSSQNAMTAIGWTICPACAGKDSRYECELCWDEEGKRWDRRVPVDAAIAWIRAHPEG